MHNRYAAFDEYGVQHFPKHLARRGRDQFLENLLFDFDWLKLKLDRADPKVLIADYDLLPRNLEVGLVQKALRLAAHVLSSDKEQLASQLLGRLLVYGPQNIQELLKQAKDHQNDPWLCPIRSGLMLPTEPLIRTLTGHTDSIRALVVSPDERLLISGCRDKLIRIWSIEDWTVLRTLSGHSGWIMALALTPDGDKVVSASWDRTIRVWNVSDGTCLFTLDEHSDPVFDVTVTPSGRYAVSASRDKTIKV
jgi:WD40 repeat protein